MGKVRKGEHIERTGQEVARELRYFKLDSLNFLGKEEAKLIANGEENDVHRE